MSIRSWAQTPLGIATALIVGCVVGIGGALVFTQSPQQAAAQREVPALPVVTAQVVSQKLVDSSEIGCSFTTRKISARPPHRTGRVRVVTAIGVRAGSALRSGTLVAGVSNQPLFAFATSVPFFRDLHLGDRGVDVKGLEQGLVAAGRLRHADSTFDQAALNAVQAIYRKAGWSASGRFVANAAWAVPPGSTVREVQVRVGDVVKRDAELVIAASGNGHWECRAPSGISADVGTTLNTAAGASTLSAKVTAVGIDDDTHESVLTVSLPASVDPDEPVTATVVSQVSSGAVLTVPAGAIFSAGDSATTVRVVENGTTREVPVTVGTTAGGWIEVSGGGLAAGQSVQIRGS